MDIFESALQKLRSDKTPLNEIERSSGIAAETLRDIKRGITKSPRLSTMRSLVDYYQRQETPA